MIAFISYLATSFLSCKKNYHEKLETLCKDIPPSWKYEIIYDNFDSSDITYGMSKPYAIVKFKNDQVKFRDNEISVSSSFILNVYLITLKPEIIDKIHLYSILSYRTPMNYGETKDFYFVTSRSFFKHPYRNKSVDELHKNLKKNLIIDDKPFRIYEHN